MGIHHDLIADFAQYAKMQLEDHTNQLKLKYRSKDASAETFRLKVFNDHLQALKGQLHHKMADLSGNTSVDNLLKKELEKKYEQYINDFLKRDFNI